MCVVKSFGNPNLDNCLTLTPQALSLSIKSIQHPLWKIDIDLLRL
jgi:hypothetical protein